MSAAAAGTLSSFSAELSRIDDEARALVAGLSEAQAGWQPDGGTRWSITQNLQHLAKTNEVYVVAMREGLRRPQAADGAQDLAAIPGLFGRWFISGMEPPPRLRIKTRRIVQPPPTGSLRDALDAFLASNDLVRAFVKDASGYDLRAKFKSPFGPVRWAIATGLLVLLAHDRRHLWQARQVMKSPGFPGAGSRD